MRRRTAVATMMLAGLLAAGGGAGGLAQKPPALGAPQAAPAPVPLPVPAPPAAGGATDKFGLPIPPQAAAPGGTDKFGLPVAPGGAQGGGQAEAAAPARPRGPAPPIPPDEPAAVRALRALLGPDVWLRYATAEVADPARGGAVRLREVVLEPPDARLAIAELSFDGLRDDGVQEAEARGLRATDADGGGEEVRIDRLRVEGLVARRPAPGEELAPDAVTLGALRLEGLSLAGETPVALATLAIEDYGPGRATRVALEGLEIRQPAGGGALTGPVERISLGRLTLGGLDLAGTVAALAGERAPPRPTGSWTLEAEALALGAGGRSMGGLETFRLSGEAPATGPETGLLAMRGIRVEPFPGLAEWLERFGYAALQGDLTAETRYERESGRLEVTALSLAARDIGALGLSLTLEGATPEALESRDADGLRLGGFTLRYLDQSLYARFVRQQARQTRQTEPQVRQQLAQQAGALLAAQGRDAAAVAPIRTAVQRFLRGEAREIEITARPPRPVALSDLAGAVGGAGEAQRLLGLSAVAR
jgi:hypothetical protein